MQNHDLEMLQMQNHFVYSAATQDNSNCIMTGVLQIVLEYVAYSTWQECYIKILDKSVPKWQVACKTALFVIVHMALIDPEKLYSSVYQSTTWPAYSIKHYCY